MSSFVAFGSRRVSLAECSRSSFALVVTFCVQVRIFLLLPAMPTRAGFPTGTHRHRSSNEGHSPLGQRACAYDERIASANH
jgi:hypothetical protein